MLVRINVRKVGPPIAFRIEEILWMDSRLLKPIPDPWELP
jgi:hypothetical protein